MEISRLEKINIVDKEHLIEVLEKDLSLNYQLGLHNSMSINHKKVIEETYETIDSIFTNGYRIEWPDLRDFTRPFGDVSYIKENSLEEFYNYDYWHCDYVQNYIFTLPKTIIFDKQNYFLGLYKKDEKSNLLTSYLFSEKNNIPREFIYGVLLKNKDFGCKLIKNSNHMRLMDNKSVKNFYNYWLNDIDKKALQAIMEDNLSITSFEWCGLSEFNELVENTIEQKYRVMQKKN